MSDHTPNREDVTSLIWEYLDGEITDERAEQLSAALSDQADSRDQFAESVVLHGMLCQYFQSEPKPQQDHPSPGRSSAA